MKDGISHHRQPVILLILGLSIAAISFVHLPFPIAKATGISAPSDLREARYIENSPVTPVAEPTPLSPFSTFIRTIDLPANDLVLSPMTNSLYVSVPSSAEQGRGNTVTRIDPVTGDIIGSTFVGNEPNRLAISFDGGTLYAEIDGAPDAIRILDVASGTAGLQFEAPSYFGDMKVSPGQPSLIAFAEGSGGAVSVYDNGVRRQNISSGVLRSVYSVAFTDSMTLYGYDNNSSRFDLGRFIIEESGVSGSHVGEGLISGFGVQITSVNGLIYATNGQVFDPATNSVIGRFGAGGSAMTIDPQLGRAFFLTGTVLTAYDLDTFAKIGSVSFPVSYSFPTSLARWGDNGLAFRTANTAPSGSPSNSRVVILQSELVSPNTEVPVGLRLAGPKLFTSETNSSPFVFSIYRTGDLSGTVTVSYSTVDGTALAGEDYVPASGTLSFAPGEFVKGVQVPIFVDNLYEGTEDLEFTLTGVSGDKAGLVWPSNATVSITDYESRPLISISDVDVIDIENGGETTVNVPISLSYPSTETISALYSTANGSAEAGLDYVSANGTVIFAPHETSKTIPVTIIGDNLTEALESFTLRLTSISNAREGRSVATISIRDEVSVSGRVLTPDGRGLRNAAVSLIDTQGRTVIVSTSSLGFYSFDGVLGKASYLLRVNSKRFRFSSLSIQTDGNLSGVDFVGAE